MISHEKVAKTHMSVSLRAHSRNQQSTQIFTTIQSTTAIQSTKEKMLVITADDMLRRGLELGGFDANRQKRVKRKTNLRRFNALYGSNPVVYAEIFEDLQTTMVFAARVDPEVISVDYFLSGIHFLKNYQTEEVRAGVFKVCEKTCRDWGWFYAMKIQALKEQKIVWPEHWKDGHPLLHDRDTPVFLITVDGVHCRVGEPFHPVFSKNPEYYSHKSNQAGLGYELGLSVYENALVWLKGPSPAGKHDITTFREELKGKIPAGKRVIGGNGYKGESKIISTPNSHDLAELRRFKSRARARHESFNGRIKNFKCLSERFRHGIDKHHICFEAVCDIVQYQLENGSPLFDV
jgi:hypothetical protein